MDENKKKEERLMTACAVMYFVILAYMFYEGAVKPAVDYLSQKPAEERKNEEPIKELGNCCVIPVIKDTQSLKSNPKENFNQYSGN